MIFSVTKFRPGLQMITLASVMRISDSVLYVRFFLRASSNSIARAFAPHEIGILQRFGLAVDGDGGDRMIRRFVRQACEAHAEAVLLEFDLLTACKEAGGFHAGLYARERDRFSGPKINVPVESVALAPETRVPRTGRLASAL